MASLFDECLMCKWLVMADLKKLEEDAVGFAQQAISFDQQGLCEMAFFYYCVSVILLS